MTSGVDVDWPVVVTPAPEPVELTPEEMLDSLAELRVTCASIALPYDEQIRQLEAERDNECRSVDAADKALVDEIKTKVLLGGKTKKGQAWQAVWSKGRTTWNDDSLTAYAEDHPAILKWRKVGDPSVAIREVK